MPGPLSDLTVIELGGIGPVPHAGMVLGDLGADVIQVAPPAGDPPIASGLLNRGKRSIVVDLKNDDGRQVVLDLVETAQAVVEGFRPGVAERLGVGPDDCLGRNPSLAYGRMTGWGQTGPLADAAGHDIDYIAVAGALAAVGTIDEPVPPLNLVGDFGGGSMLLVIGVLAAVHEAGRTGTGQVVDAAMVDGAALLMAMHHGALAEGRWTTSRGANLLDGAAPFYTTYLTSDGHRMAVGALEPQFYTALLERLGLDSADLPEQTDRGGWPELRSRLAAVFSTRTRREWEDVFAGSDACVTGVYDMEEAPGHPHLVDRGTFVEIDGVSQPAAAPRFSATPAAVPGPIPRPGQHTEDVLSRLGYEPELVDRLRNSGAIR